jgi:type II secretory pathway pseudopilin PulG
VTLHPASRTQDNRHLPGYTLAGVLVLIGIMSVMMAMALPVWDRIKQRENEEELIFRGKEYMEAIGRYHIKFNSYPPDLDTLLKMKFIRKLYKDPMTENGEWKVLHPGSLVETGEAGFINQPGTKDADKDKEDPKEVIPGLGGAEKEDSADDSSGEGEEQSTGPVVGVVSRSKKTALRIYNGQSTYDKWVFAYVPQQDQQPPSQPQQPGKKQDDKKQKDPKRPQPKNPDVDKDTTDQRR